MYQRFNGTFLTVCFIACVSLTLGGSVVMSGCATGMAQMDSSFESFPRSITVEQAAEKKEKGAFFLDVREPEEWVQARMPGSILIPLDQLRHRLDELPKDKEIVVICRSGNRSTIGLDIIRNAGFAKSTSMKGGLIQWHSSGYLTESGAQSAQ